MAAAHLLILGQEVAGEKTPWHPAVKLSNNTERALGGGNMLCRCRGGMNGHAFVESIHSALEPPSHNRKQKGSNRTDSEGKSNRRERVGVELPDAAGAPALMVRCLCVTAHLHPSQPRIML
jgi:hypothetical protein